MCLAMGELWPWPPSWWVRDLTAQPWRLGGIAYLAAYCLIVLGHSLLGLVRWGKALVSELLDLLKLAGQLPAAWRECRASWRPASGQLDALPGRDGARQRARPEISGGGRRVDASSWPAGARLADRERPL